MKQWPHGRSCVGVEGDTYGSPCFECPLHSAGLFRALGEKHSHTASISDLWMNPLPSSAGGTGERIGSNRKETGNALGGENDELAPTDAPEPGSHLRSPAPARTRARSLWHSSCPQLSTPNRIERFFISAEGNVTWIGRHGAALRMSAAAPQKREAR